MNKQYEDVDFDTLNNEFANERISDFPDGLIKDTTIVVDQYGFKIKNPTLEIEEDGFITVFPPIIKE